MFCIIMGMFIIFTSAALIISYILLIYYLDYIYKEVKQFQKRTKKRKRVRRKDMKEKSIIKMVTGYVLVG